MGGDAARGLLGLPAVVVATDEVVGQLSATGADDPYLVVHWLGLDQALGGRLLASKDLEHLAPFVAGRAFRRWYYYIRLVVVKYGFELG